MTEDERERRFRALYGRARPCLFAYALRRTLSPEDAADVVAETFLIAWRRLDAVPDGEASLLWLYAACRRVIANQSRRAAGVGSSSRTGWAPSSAPPSATLSSRRRRHGGGPGSPAARRGRQGDPDAGRLGGPRLGGARSPARLLADRRTHPAAPGPGADRQDGAAWARHGTTWSLSTFTHTRTIQARRRGRRETMNKIHQQLLTLDPVRLAELEAVSAHPVFDELLEHIMASPPGLLTEPQRPARRTSNGSNPSCSGAGREAAIDAHSSPPSPGPPPCSWSWWARVQSLASRSSPAQAGRRRVGGPRPVRAPRPSGGSSGISRRRGGRCRGWGTSRVCSSVLSDHDHVLRRQPRPSTTSDSNRSARRRVRVPQRDRGHS